MKWLVKILAVMLVLCILLTLFVACKKKGEESEGEDEQTNNSSSGGTKQDIQSSIEDNEDLDGENHDITDDTLDAGQFN